MNAQVVTALFQPGKVEEGVREFRDHVVPRIMAHSGFKGALMLTDSSTGKMIALTLWETEAELKATESSFQESVARVGQGLAGPPTRELYDVSVQA